MKATFDLTWESKKPSAGNHLPNFAGFDEKYQFFFDRIKVAINVLQSNKIKENLDKLLQYF